MENNKKQSLIQELVKVFKDETKKYADSLEEVLNFNVDEYYRKNDIKKGYHSVDACISFKDYIVKFEYKINISFLIPKTTLEIRFMFNNGKLPVEYSIYDVLQVINEEDFKCYTVPYIINKKQMESALKYLFKTFKKYKKRIEKLALDESKIQIIENNIQNKIYLLLREKIFETRSVTLLTRFLELYYTVDLSRFTSNTYILYLKGKYKRALKKYNKNNDKLTIYEKRLVSHIHKIIEEKGKYQALPHDLTFILDNIKLKSPKTQLLPMYFSWIILTFFWGLIYSLLFMVSKYFFTKGAIFVSGLDVFYALLPSFLTAIVSSYFTKNISFRIFNKKRYEDLKVLEEIENRSSIQIFMNKFTQFIIALSIVFVILLSNTNISFYNETFVDNMDILKIEGIVYEYSDIKCVYESDGFLNEFGNVVNSKTYVIVLKDDTEINLYDLSKPEEITNILIPIFKEKKIDIKRIDLVENIKKDK